MHIRPAATKRTSQLFFAAVLHTNAMIPRTGKGNLFRIHRNNKSRAVALSDITNWGGKELNLYLLTKVDCIIHTAGTAECVVIGYMMDGQAAWAPIALGYSSIYLLIYLFLHPKRPSQTQDLPKVQLYRVLASMEMLLRSPRPGGPLLSMCQEKGDLFWGWRYNVASSLVE